MFAQVVVYQEPRDDTTPKHMVFVVGQSVVYPNMFDVNGLIVSNCVTCRSIRI